MSAQIQEFFIPQDPIDLEDAAPGRYSVSSVLSFSGEDSPSAEAVVTAVAERVLDAKDVFTTVLDHAVFDKAYSLIKCVCAFTYSAPLPPPPLPPPPPHARSSPHYPPPGAGPTTAAA